MKFFSPISTLSLLIAISFSVGATDIEGNISGYFSAGTYTVVDDINVPVEEELILAPGVIFEFEEGAFTQYNFDVFGTLTADGLDTNPVIFRAADGVDEYNYIKIMQSSSRLSYCIIEDAGKVGTYSEGGLWIDNCSPIIENCIIQNNKWHGVLVSGSAAVPQITNCIITGNNNNGISCKSSAGIDVTLCEIIYNGADGVSISDGSNSIVNCLMADNGEDGLDCYGIINNHALVVNCTIVGNSGEQLSDAPNFELINTVVVDKDIEVGEATCHTLIMEEEWFFEFVDPGSGNYELLEGSPLIENGTRFGTVAGLLPDTDLNGNPRINGIIDIGCYESTATPPTGEEGEYFSSALLCPRMTLPVIRTPGETFDIQISRLGTFTPGDVQVTLTDPLGSTYNLSVLSVEQEDAVPGSLLETLMYIPGIERIQTIEVEVPYSVPADFFDIEVRLGGDRTYQSIHAVRILDSYPDDWGFIHITDSHVNYDEEEISAYQRLMGFVTEANFVHPEFIVLTGDVCEDQELGNYYVDSLLHGISLSRIPIYVIPGNHDYYNLDYGYYPQAWMRYFQKVNRIANSEFRFGEARVYGLDSQYDVGTTQLWRCYGPSDESLDWVEDLLNAGSASGPLFFAMHGPNYDYFSWNVNNVARVKDIMNDWSFSLYLCGHTHRQETFNNEGDNYLGRNDYSSDDDWGRDVAFPGYPLHVQTSSLGKDEHLPWPGREECFNITNNRSELESLWKTIESDNSNGPFGDSISWRWVAIDGSEVTFFTSDTDGDGYRNTELGWPLGFFEFSITTQGDSIISSVFNDHYEIWYNVHHYIPAVPGVTYEVTGGTLIRQYPDGTVEVLVDEVDMMSTTEVILYPQVGIGETSSTSGTLRLLSCGPNPFSSYLSIPFEIPTGGALVTIEILDITGKTVRVLMDENITEGMHEIVWDRMDSDDILVPAGVYFCVMRSGNFSASQKLMVLN